MAQFLRGRVTIESMAISKGNEMERALVDALGLHNRHARKITLTFEVGKVPIAEVEFFARDEEDAALATIFRGIRFDPETIDVTPLGQDEKTE